MDVGQEASAQSLVALRVVLCAAGGLMLLLIVLAVVRPDMMMSVLHHAEAMSCMDTGATH